MRAIRDGVSMHSPEQTLLLLDLYKKVPQLDADIQKLFIESIDYYASNHLLAKGSADSFINKLLPALVNNDPQVDILRAVDKNIFAMGHGEFGLGDLVIRCYALDVTPLHINELLMDMRQVPGTTLAKLDQNRTDAIDLNWSSFREIAHDQRPYVHELVKTLIGYYTTGRGADLDDVINRAIAYDGESYSAHLQGICREVGLYPSDEDALPEEVRMHVKSNPKPNKVFYDEIPPGNNKQETRIEILKRILKNTEPVVEKPPVTSDQELNGMINALDAHFENHNLERTLVYVNGKLKEMMEHGAVGIEPNLLFTIAWLDGQGAKKFQTLPHANQLYSYKLSWFAALLEFHELTFSPSIFDQEEFQAFLTKMRGTVGPEYAYKLLFDRIMYEQAALAETYKSQHAFDTDIIWSGNLTNSFLRLMDIAIPAHIPSKQELKAQKEASGDYVED